MKNNKILWLDDYRNPFERDWIEKFSPIKNNIDIYWVKSYNEFVSWIQSNGLPDGVCFDHDLGFEHIKYYFDNGGHQNPPDPSKANFVEKTGYDAAKWLVGHYMDNFTSPFPQIYVHSANPVGAANIVNYINGFLKHLDKEQTAKLKVHPFTIQEK